MWSTLARKRFQSWFLLFACNLMWALQFTCYKSVQDQVGPLFTVWGPMTLATAMLYPFVRSEKGVESQKGGRKRLDFLVFLLLAALGVFPGQVLGTWGTRMSLASDAALLSVTAPICTAVLAVILLGERMTGIRWSSFAFAIAGVAMCSNIGFRTLDLGVRHLFGNALIVISNLGSAFYNSYGKKVLARYSPTEMLFFTYVAMFVIMTPLVLVKEGHVLARIPGFTVRTWVGLALLTFFHNFLSMVLFLKALKQLDAIQAAVANYLVAFFGVPIAVIWLKEKLTLLGIVGGLMVLFSTLLVTLWEDRHPPALTVQD